jgi:hypothetical protein
MSTLFLLAEVVDKVEDDVEALVDVSVQQEIATSFHQER